ncbi:hypothetical protein DPMN_084807 [Dreissena polymorpha]|uniref:Uncharacterized protein n=1 Tax=Dreissena polymorpha TaxID=45954 RepID=A0A9D3YFK1_DREPO|nr:hypothetical protein DPMN_084807 [Dreissena polymorpha]
MIPERHLMEACGLEDALQSKWVADITDMMEEGPRVILRLEKIRKAIVASPEPMMWFSSKRMEQEMLYLEVYNRMSQCENENKVTDSDFIMKALYRRLKVVCTEVGLRIFLEGGSITVHAIRTMK